MPPKRKHPAPPKLASEESEDEPSQPSRRVHFKSSSAVGGGHFISRGPPSSTQEAKDVDEEVNSDEEQEETKITMAIASTKKALGIAYFSPVFSVLYLTEDVPIANEAAAIDLARMRGSPVDTCQSEVGKLALPVVEQVKPEVVLVSVRASDELVNALQEILSAMAVGEQVTGLPTTSSSPVLKIRPAREFSDIAGHSALLSLRIVQRATHGQELFHDLDDSSTASGFSGYGRRPAKLQSSTSAMTAQALVNSDASQVTLSSISCLLSYLSRNTAGQPDAKWDQGIDVRSIELLSFDSFMHLPMSTLTSLSIFSIESHASLHSSKTSEGLSLFGILDSCRTAQGRHLLRSWLQRPSLNRTAIECRADVIECLGRPDNMHCLTSIGADLKSTHSLTRVVRIIEGGRARINDWRSLLRGLHGIIFLKEALTNLVGLPGSSILETLLHTVEPGLLNNLGHAIDSVIDWEETKIQGGSRVCVKPGVDETLDELKTRYATLESILDQLAREMSKGVSPELADEFTICYFPQASSAVKVGIKLTYSTQLGYLCRIEAEEWWESKPIYKEAGWEFQFLTDEHVYFKSDEMRDCDTHIGDVQSAIRDRELEIIHALESEIAQYDDLFRTISGQLAELDGLVSLTEIARQGEWVRPQITDENVIKIRAGRHPLVEAFVDVYISNDTSLTGGMGVGCHNDFVHSDLDPPHGLLRSDLSLLVVTGANFSGKSAYLKQVALIVVLAQIGSFVPAKEVTLGLCDAIFTRVSTRESVSKGDSAFLIDLQQVSYMLRNCTNRSLLLIDEFGKGTQAGDGQGLFCGVMRHLAERGEECPKTIFATHFHAVFANELFPLHLPIGFAHMQIVLPEDTDSTTDASSFTYLYSLAPALAAQSHALACAALFGIPQKVRRRAEEVSDMLGRFEILELIDVGMTEDEKASLRETENIVRRFVDVDLGIHLGDAPEDTKAWLRDVLGEVDNSVEHAEESDDRH